MSDPDQPLESASSTAQQDSADKLQLARDYYAIFEADRRGQRVLEDLERRFALHSGAVTDGGIDAILKTYRGEGQRSVVMHIVNQMNIGQAND